jgi:hypothetical protein
VAALPAGCNASGTIDKTGLVMKNIEKLPSPTKTSGPDALSIDELRRQVAELTEANAALRQRTEELLAYQDAIKPIVNSLLNNPFADIDWLRHKAHKAMRPRKPGA